VSVEVVASTEDVARGKNSVELLKEVLQEVKTMSSRQASGPGTAGDLDATHRRLSGSAKMWNAAQEDVRRLMDENRQLSSELVCCQEKYTAREHERACAKVDHKDDGEQQSEVPDETTRETSRLSMSSDVTIREGELRRTLEADVARELRRHLEKSRLQEQSLKEQIAQAEAQAKQRERRLLDELSAARADQAGLEGKLAQEEIPRLKRVIEEQKKTIWSLESQMRQERAVSKVLSPGDFLRAQARAEEHGDHMSAEIDTLRRALAESRAALAECSQALAERDDRLANLGRQAR